MDKNLTKQDRIAGGLYGLLIGDALGVPYEFYEAEKLPPCDEIEMIPPAGFRKTYENGGWHLVGRRSAGAVSVPESSGSECFLPGGFLRQGALLVRGRRVGRGRRSI